MTHSPLKPRGSRGLLSYILRSSVSIKRVTAQHYNEDEDNDMEHNIAVSDQGLNEAGAWCHTFILMP